MTEEEAKTKWCPFSRTHGGPDGATQVVSANRYLEADEAMFDTECCCIASDCACWQWLGDKSGGWCGLTNPGFSL